LVEDTIRQGFEYRYFVIKNNGGKVQAIQPFFILDQDLLAGVDPTPKLARSARRIWPRFLKLRTLMVGCAVGEGHLDGEESSHEENASLLAAAIVSRARYLGVSLIVLKEFPAKYRASLNCFLHRASAECPVFR
jgi:hypothetical protein